MKKRHWLSVVFSLMFAAAIFVPTIMSSFSANAISVIPDPAEYNLEETLIGGKFDEFETGKVFGLSAINGWGSNVAFDYPAVVIEESGNKMLKLGKGNGSEPYASAFVFYSKDFDNDDVMTVEFEYKLDVEDMNDYSAAALSGKDGESEGETIDFSFTSQNNQSHHIVKLDGTNPAMTTGENNLKWPVTYSDGANGEGWKKVSMTLIVNRGTLEATSLRWLMPVTAETAATDAMYIDNVSIIRWVSKTAVSKKPVLTSDAAVTVSKKDPTDVTVTIDTKGLVIGKIERIGADNKSVNVGVKYATKTLDGQTATAVIKAELFSTLDAGEYKFIFNTNGGSVSVTITVTKEGSGCGSAVTAMSLAGAALAAAGLIGLTVAVRRKNSKKDV